MTWRLYQTKTEPVSTEAGQEVIYPDKWLRPLSNPVLRTGISVALIASGAVISPWALTQAEAVQESKWHQPYSEPVLTRPFNTSLQQSNTYVPVFSQEEIVTLDKWYQHLSLPVRIPQALLAGLQQEKAFGAPPIIPSYGWYVNLASPVRGKPPIPTGAQQAIAAGYLPIIPSYSWAQSWHVPVRTKTTTPTDQSYAPHVEQAATIDWWLSPFSNPIRLRTFHASQAPWEAKPELRICLSSITQTGSTLFYSTLTGLNSGTVSSTISVPADAEVVVVALTAFGSGSVSNYFSDGTVTFTKGGVATPMTSAGSGGNSDVSLYKTAMWYMALPDTGSNKTLTWDWFGGSLADGSDNNWSITFWKGVDTSSPVRDSNGAQASDLPVTTPLLSAITGDLIVAFAGGFDFLDTSSGEITGWTNLTVLSETAYVAGVEGAWATSCSPTGDIAVGAASGAKWDDPSIMAVVLREPFQRDTIEWWSGLSEPVRLKGGLREGLQQTVAYPPGVVQLSYGWYQPLASPKRSRPWLYSVSPEGFYFTGEANPVPSMATWNYGWSGPVRLRAGLLAAQQTDTTMPVIPQPNPPAPTGQYTVSGLYVIDQFTDNTVVYDYDGGVSHRTN